MKQKARCEVRLDPAVHERIKLLADDCGLSLNQLVEGILAWAGTNAYPGVPTQRLDDATVATDPESHIVWFGHDGMERDPEGHAIGADGDGQISFILDFRATRAMVNGWEVEHGE